MTIDLGMPQLLANGLAGVPARARSWAPTWSR